MRSDLPAPTDGRQRWILHSQGSYTVWARTPETMFVVEGDVATKNEMERAIRRSVMREDDWPLYDVPGVRHFPIEGTTLEYVPTQKRVEVRTSTSAEFFPMWQHAFEGLTDCFSVGPPHPSRYRASRFELHRFKWLVFAAFAWLTPMAARQSPDSRVTTDLLERVPSNAAATAAIILAVLAIAYAVEPRVRSARSWILTRNERELGR